MTAAAIRLTTKVIQGKARRCCRDGGASKVAAGVTGHGAISGGRERRRSCSKTGGAGAAQARSEVEPRSIRSPGRRITVEVILRPFTTTPPVDPTSSILAVPSMA
jgi:hypothetical protein